MKQLTTEQRLTRLIELKAQRDEIDREIAVILGEPSPPARRVRPPVRAINSGSNQTVKAVESADANLSVDSNGVGS